MEKQQPIVALMYDFDKTLCAKDMQEYSFISKCWDECRSILERIK
ncbi:MAG: hypothetical protein ACLU5J_04645 [Christensenellales bacterium]